MAPFAAILPALLPALTTAATTIGVVAPAADVALTAGGLGSTLATIGTGLSAVGTIYGGIRENQAAGAEAKSMQQRGNAEYAIAERKMIEDKRQGALVGSRARAVAAASGGGVSNPTVDSVLTKIQTQSDYNAMTDMYNGAQSRADLYDQAKSRVREGTGALIGSAISAGSTIYSGIANQRRYGAEYSYYGR